MSTSPSQNPTRDGTSEEEGRPRARPPVPPAVSRARPPVPSGTARSRARPIAVPASSSDAGSGSDDNDDDSGGGQYDDGSLDKDDDEEETPFFDDDDDDDDDDPRLRSYAESPGSSSYVSAPDSWRGVPPPMLASSFDARFRPSLLSPASSSASLVPPRRAAAARYGAVDSDASGYSSDAVTTTTATPTETSASASASVATATAPRRQRARALYDRTLAAPSETLSDAKQTALQGIGDDAALGQPLSEAVVDHTMPHSNRPWSKPGIRQHKPSRHHRHHHHVSTPWKNKLAKLFVQWRTIFHAPRELWIIFILKFLSSCSCRLSPTVLVLFATCILCEATTNSTDFCPTLSSILLSGCVAHVRPLTCHRIQTMNHNHKDAYFALSLVLTMFLTEEFGLSDTAAGWSYGLYGVMSTVFGFACGWIIDYLGVRVSLLVGGSVGAASRLILALTPSHRTAKLMLYTALPFSECLGIPIMTIGIKRYTNSQNRTFAFSLFYSMMNIAALIVGPVVDMARRTFSAPLVLDLHAVGFEAIFELSALRLIVLSSAIASAAMMLGVVAGIREIEVDDHGNVSTFEPNRSSPMGQTWTVLRDPAFWRLTVFTLLIVGVRLVFRHLDATLPKYLVREFGPTAPFGAVYAINPFLVVWLVPLIGLFTRSVNSFAMILCGSFVSAVSPFWVCVGPHYWTVILFMVTLSVGEAIYSPRVYEYTMEVAGRGSEGLYSSLSSAPLFSVKLLVGGMSGWLLTSFMPADNPDERNGTLMWAIIGATSLTSPILMFALRSYLAPPELESAQAAKRGAPSAALYVPIASNDSSLSPIQAAPMTTASATASDVPTCGSLMVPRDPLVRNSPRTGARTDLS